MHNLDYRREDPVVDTAPPARTPAIVLQTGSRPSERALIVDRAPSRTVGHVVAHQPTGLIAFERLSDVVLSLILLTILAPLLVLVAALIVVSDRGPVLFAHRRLGRDGRMFDCLKFRTMRTDAEAALPQLLVANPALQEEWDRSHKLTIDPRVTPLGRILRTTSLDELPQLLNVLRGDMSLVGPRPIVPTELHRYGRYAAHYFSVKPGLTGLWQVSGRSSTSYRRRVAADVYYVRSKSWLLDTRILLCTLPAVFNAEGSC